MILPQVETCRNLEEVNKFFQHVISTTRLYAIYGLRVSFYTESIPKTYSPKVEATDY